MTREKHLLGHLIFQTNEEDVAVASKQMFFKTVSFEINQVYLAIRW
jgi:hypothetical protein